MKARYRFSHRGADDRLYWDGPRIDSRIEQVSCPAAWFYGQMVQS
jgi:hypothetical protein